MMNSPKIPREYQRNRYENHPQNIDEKCSVPLQRCVEEIIRVVITPRCCYWSHVALLKNQTVNNGIRKKSILAQRLFIVS